MEFLANPGLFSQTVENRFVFALFDVLLCGVILLVIVRGWRAQERRTRGKHPLFLLLAFLLLGASFGLGAMIAGAFLFFHVRLPEPQGDLLKHALQTGAWLLLATSAYQMPKCSRPAASTPRDRSSTAGALFPGLALLLIRPIPQLHAQATTALDIIDPFLLAAALFIFRRRVRGGQKLTTAALAFLFIGALLHLGSSWQPDSAGAVILWNLEQFTWSLCLFTFALAIGETSRNLFDKVLVRLQIAFILLASVMILVIVQTEKTEYLASIRGRSEQLGEFVRAHVDYFRGRQQPLPAILDQEDFRQRVTLGFASLQELKIVRISTGGLVATFEIAENGGIHRSLEPLRPQADRTELDPDEYFKMNALPFKTGGPGQVEFYGMREFLDRHVRKRIILIFSLFTGMVILSTLMIGLVVGGASATIRAQAQEIADTQRQLMQASKLAAIGELAAGVAHEINNPATTILTRASFLLSEDSASLPESSSEDLKAIVSQGQRIAQITRGLLMFSRPQAIEIEPVPIDRILETSLREVEPAMAAQGILVSRNLEPHLPRVLADRDSLARALENLFRNSLDAMPQGGRLEIRAALNGPPEARLRLEISDTGAGIESDNLTRIFDPFFTTKKAGKGTGLGLSIVERTIKEHQGSITVESRPGAGTKFAIVLPTEG